jgi:hypothetical protein
LESTGHRRRGLQAVRYHAVTYSTPPNTTKIVQSLERSHWNQERLADFRGRKTIGAGAALMASCTKILWPNFLFESDGFASLP